MLHGVSKTDPAYAHMREPVCLHIQEKTATGSTMNQLRDFGKVTLALYAFISLHIKKRITLL